MLKLNQKGFTGLEIVLAVLLLVSIGGVGYYAYQARQNVNNDYSVNVPKKKTPSPAATQATPAPVSDNDAIVAAVNAYGPNNGHVTSVAINSIVGSNAQGHYVSSEVGSSGAFVANKGSGSWQIVYEGQQPPGNDIGQKYGLPSSWYNHN